MKRDFLVADLWSAHCYLVSAYLSQVKLKPNCICEGKKADTSVKRVDKSAM